MWHLVPTTSSCKDISTKTMNGCEPCFLISLRIMSMTIKVPVRPIPALNTKKQMHTHTHPFNDLLSRTTRVSRYQKGKTNLDFTEARDSEWHWHQLGHVQVCISLQTDNHASTPPLSFLQAGCSSCRPTNSVKAQGKKTQDKIHTVL